MSNSKKIERLVKKTNKRIATLLARTYVRGLKEGVSKAKDYKHFDENDWQWIQDQQQVKYFNDLQSDKL